MARSILKPTACGLCMVANLEGAAITQAHVDDSRALSNSAARSHPANPNRDCEELGIDPETSDRL